MTAQLVTFSQAGKLVGLSQDQIRKWAAEGKLAVKSKRFPKLVDAADVHKVFEGWERKPRAGKNWPALREVARQCGMAAEGFEQAWKQQRRFAALGEPLKLGYDLREACRSRSWVLCVHPVHAKRLIAGYTIRSSSPVGWIAQKDGKVPFPDRFPKITAGHLVSARKSTARLGEPLDEESFRITTGGHICIVKHFRVDQIAALNQSVLASPRLWRGHTPPAVNGHAAKQPATSGHIAAVPKSANDDRDKFIYAERCKSPPTPWKEIRRLVGLKKGWETLDSNAGAIVAVKRYRKRTGLPPATKGKAGRPKNTAKTNVAPQR